MSDDEIDLLSVKRGSVVAPAGCGKTQLIANALKNRDAKKPALVLTHTNSGVAALRARLEQLGVSPRSYRLSTIDGFAIRLISTFPERSGHDPNIIIRSQPVYREIRQHALTMLSARHVDDIVEASYDRLFVDEYQDCSGVQHAIVSHLACIVPTCVVGDPMQAIFTFNDALPDWDGEVCATFPVVGELKEPWRWKNAGTEKFGRWLLEIREALLQRESVDLNGAPAEVEWIQLDGTQQDHVKKRAACRANPPGGQGSVLIVGNSRMPDQQQKFASETPGAVTVEAVDLRDLIGFSQRLDLEADNAISVIAQFAETMMTNVGAADLISRVNIILRGTARRQPSDVENSAIAFHHERTYRRALDLLIEINREAGVRIFRPALLRATRRALELSCGAERITFPEAAIRIREQNRILGRTLPKRAVGSTLLLKGLEAEVVVILDGDEMNARNLYVAMTRGSKKMLMCSRDRVLTPVW